MPRWYAARKCKGTPDSEAKQVAKLVEQNNLGRALPLIRIEKRPRKGFYMFLAIESETPGELPPELLRIQEHPVFKELMREDGRIHPFRLEEAERWMSGEIDVQNYARRLTVHIPDPPAPVDPFAEPEHSGDEDGCLAERSQCWDRLLLWSSATGRGGLSAFRSATHALGLDADGSQTGSILRRLQLLGHLQRSADGQHWSTAPLVLTKTLGPDEQPGYVLCGERDGKILNALERIAPVIKTPQPRGDGPARVFLACDDGCLPEALPLPAGRLVQRAEAGKRLSEVLPCLQGWKKTLASLPGVHPEMFDIRRFDGRDFVPATVVCSGFYEFWPRESAARPRQRLYYDADCGRWLSGEWYGLRYLAQLESGLRCEAQYHFSQSCLLLPAAWRPPELYERALVLCSGRLPRYENGWLLYDGVPADVANLLAAKLRIDLATTVL